jgi:hypothetical protein
MSAADHSPRRGEDWQRFWCFKIFHNIIRDNDKLLKQRGQSESHIFQLVSRLEVSASAVGCCRIRANLTFAEDVFASTESTAKCLINFLDFPKAVHQDAQRFATSMATRSGPLVPILREDKSSSATLMASTKGEDEL